MLAIIIIMAPIDVSTVYFTFAGDLTADSCESDAARVILSFVRLIMPARLSTVETGLYR